MPWTKFPHDGGPFKGPSSAPIRPAYRGAERPEIGTRIRVAPAGRLDWSHDGGPDDIVSYEIWEPDHA